MPPSEPAAAAMASAEAQEWRPAFRQVYMQEEGTFADRVVDIAKFQNFICQSPGIVEDSVMRLRPCGPRP
jgi:hypothetical protein